MVAAAAVGFSARAGGVKCVVVRRRVDCDSKALVVCLTAQGVRLV